jgi:hypothetical protein
MRFEFQAGGESEHELLRLEQAHSVRRDAVWFRGQHNACWPLSTTLERRSPNLRSAADYFRVMLEIKPSIETFTGTTWEMPSGREIEKETRSYDLFHHFLLDSATYMAHLRHNGFPSALSKVREAGMSQ